MAKRLGVSIKTLQRWDREGILIAKRTPTDRRYYTEDQYLEYIGLASKSKRKIIAYVRVSNVNQKDDLQNQISFWYQSRIFLQQQCEKLGIELRLVSRFYPSSKLCSHCGYKKVDLKLNDRSWECPDCHMIHDRDQSDGMKQKEFLNYIKERSHKIYI